MGFTARQACIALDNKSFDKLPRDVVLLSKEMMVNAAAVALAAAAHPEGRTLTQFVQLHQIHLILYTIHIHCQLLILPSLH